MKTLIQVENLHKSYGNLALFDGASVVFSEGQKIGAIGRNGAGKSTLCRIITGQEAPDAGTVTLTSDLRLSYLRQDDPYDLEESVLAFLERHSGREEWQCAKTASRFRLKGDLLAAPIRTLPGGYRTRVKLVSMLLAEPNFLILDEPTNYLDLSTLILLENFLADFAGGFLIVSHDREFLKRTCEETLEIESAEMTLYPGTVDEYMEYKASVREQAERYNEGIEKKRKQLERFVDRFRAKASKATQAKAKMRQIERLQNKEIAKPLSTVRIRIPRVEDRKGIAVRCEGLAIGYPERTVATGIDVEFDRGARVAVLGDNGQGKTTFLRTLAGDLKPLAGGVRWGFDVSIGYYAQHVYSALDPGLTILQHLERRAAENVTRQEILDLAGSFLFRGEDVNREIRVLSGGERARVCLASLLLTKCDVLLMDEPTNHLDFETVEILGNSLESYRGTILFISHDRTFVNLLANRILDIKDGRVLPYPGTYEEYVDRLETLARENPEGEPASAPKPEAKALSKGEEILQRRKETREAIARTQADLRKIEAGLATLRKEKAGIEDDMIRYPRKWSRTKSERLAETGRLIEAGEASWLEASVRLDELKAMLLKQ